MVRIRLRNPVFKIYSMPCDTNNRSHVQSIIHGGLAYYYCHLGISCRCKLKLADFVSRKSLEFPKIVIMDASLFQMFHRVIRYSAPDPQEPQARANTWAASGSGTAPA